MMAIRLFLLFAAAAPAFGDDATAMPIPPGAPPTAAPKAGGEEGKPEFPPFAEVTKDMKTREGFFTLYQDEKKEKLFARIPKGMLNKNFLMATSIAKGRELAGWQWMDGPVYWDRLGKKLVLMAAEPRYAPGKGTSVEDVISRTYTDSIVRALTIVTENEGDPVVDLGELTKSDIMQMGEVFGGRVDSGLSRFGDIKNFEKNTEVSVNLAIMPGPRRPGVPAGSRGEIVGVHYSFSSLRESDYQPREADPRVGYFVTVLRDWSASHNDKTTFKRYINRWQVRKAELDKEVSDVRPDDQIIFYVEKTVPVKYRSFVRDGILEWNKAFEAAGLRNAIAVRQQTDKNEYADIDPEDVRYNFFRWMVTGGGYAMGPSRANPFTGQILDADIVFDDSMIRYLLQEYEIAGPKSFAAHSDPAFEDFLARNPGAVWQPVNPWNLLSADAEKPVSITERVETLRSRNEHHPLRPCNHQVCELGTGMTRQLAFAQMLSAQAGQRNLSDEFIGQVIKEIVMHEVGHTLGLRHNFKASTWLKLADIKNRPKDQATAASVMDYLAFNFAPSAAEQGLFDSPTIGPYDFWAIEYGYRHYMPGKDAKPKTPSEPDGKETTGATDGAEPKKGSPSSGTMERVGERGGAGGSGPGTPGPKGEKKAAKAPEGEKAMLLAIASRCNEPGLAYATDEDTMFTSPDPLVNRFDNGDDPLVFAKDRVDAVQRLWKDGLDWAVKDGESWVQARRAMNNLLGEIANSIPFAARMIGGQYINRNHKGDPNAKPPIQPVAAEDQRKALKFVADTALADNAFQFPPGVLTKLAAGRWGHWDSDEFTTDVTYDIQSKVLSIQSWILFRLMNPFTLNRVYDAQFLAVEDNAFTVPELLNTVSKVVWSELDQAGGASAATARQPAISSYRRSLQRYHAQSLIDVTLARPGSLVYADVQSVVRYALKELGGRIDKSLNERQARLDEFTRAHLVDTSTRIKKALEAEFVANPKPASAEGTTVRIGKELRGWEAPTE